jgi:hypothetical protein
VTSKKKNAENAKNAKNAKFTYVTCDSHAITLSHQENQKSLKYQNYM